MIKISLEINKAPKGLSKKYSAARKVAGQEYINHIKHNIIPKKFTKEGEREYFYEPRSLTHKRKKMQRYGHAEPLTFSGNLKMEVMKMNTDENVTPSNIKLKLKGLPRYAFMGRGRRTLSEIQQYILKHPNKPLVEIAQEMTTQLGRYVTLGEVIRESENRGTREGKQPDIQAELKTFSRSDIKNLMDKYKESASTELNKMDNKKQIIQAN